MSVAIATRGMFRDGHSNDLIAGGAPSGPAMAEKYELDPFNIKVLKVHFESINKKSKPLDISIKDVNFDDV